METAKVLTCTQSNDKGEREAKLRQKTMRHFLVPQTTSSSNHSASHSSLGDEARHNSSKISNCKRSSVSSLYSHYHLIQQRRHLRTDEHLRHSYRRSTSEDEPFVCDQPEAPPGVPPPGKLSTSSSFGLWFPTVQAASPTTPSAATSTLPNIFTSGSATGAKETGRPVTPTSASASTNRASSSSSSGSGQASAHCLAAATSTASSVFTSALQSPSASSAAATSARVNLMSNSGASVTTIQQHQQPPQSVNSFLLSLSRLAASAQPFTPTPAPATIKLINSIHHNHNHGYNSSSSSGGGVSSTGAPTINNGGSSTFFGQASFEESSALKTATTTAASFEQQCSAAARPRPAAAESATAEHHQQQQQQQHHHHQVPRYPHRHTSIYDSFDQQAQTSSTYHHQQQQQQQHQYHHHLQPRHHHQSPSSTTASSIGFHPSLVQQQPQQQQQQHSSVHLQPVNTTTTNNSGHHHRHQNRSHVSQQLQLPQLPLHFSLIHHQFNHLTLAEKERFERLFREIDINGNGFIDFNDLVHTLEAKGIRATHDNVKHLIDRSDRNADGDIDFAEFVTYCLENEKKLHVLFKDIDLNDDGKIDESELVHAFERAGVEVDQAEVLKLVHRIKEKNDLLKNGEALELNFEEFRDYLLLHPTDSLQDLMKSWRHGTFVDLGEDGLMPVDFSENEIRSGMWWRHLIAGGVAGAVSRTATAPLDRLKVFLQVRGAEFNGLGICLRHMIAEGGVISLWRGNGINVLKIAPETAIKFMAFDQMKRWIHSSKSAGDDITVMERFLAGSAAGAISQTVIYPMEVLKTRFCLRSTGQYSGLMDAARKINAQGGLRNFYRGYVPNLLGIIPYAGIDLTIYETLKKTYLLHHSMEEAPIFVCLACGTISSTFGQIASYPLALVRTRMQSELGYHRSSMYGMFRSIYAKEGPKGLYRGITANIMKVAPAVSISYVVYEYTRRPLGAIMS